MTPTTLPEALSENRSRSRFINFIHGENQETEVSYQVLYERALGILHYFQQQGLTNGDELILLLDNDQQFIDAFWACQLGGIIPVPIAAGASPDQHQKLFNVFDTLSRPRILTNGNIMARLKLFASEHPFQDQLAAIRRATIDVNLITFGSQAGNPHACEPEDTALLQFSSGSTGDPKGVVLTHRNLLTNIKAIISAARLTRDDSLLSWMPLTHDMGIIGFHLTPLVLGMNQHKMSPETFARRPLLWLSKASEKRVTILSSPNFGYRHFLKLFQERSRQGATYSWELDRVRLVFNGAEPISGAIAQAFCGALAEFGLPRTSMFPVYGLAEASLAVTFSEPGEGLSALRVARRSLKVGTAPRLITNGEWETDCHTLVCVGQPVPHCEVRIVNADTETLPEARLGHIQIRGKNVSPGYYTTQGGLDRSGRTPDGWLDTGDLGFFHQRNLYISGRTKDTIIIHGVTYFPQDLEQLCAQLEGVDPDRVLVAGCPEADSEEEQPVVFIRYRGDLAAFVELAARVKHHLAEQTLLTVKDVLPVRQLPRTSSGKYQRYQLREALLEGEYDALSSTLTALEQTHAAPHSETAENPMSQLSMELLEIVRAIIPDQHIEATDNLIDLGADSLALVQLLEEVDERYPGQLEITDFLDYQSVAELAAYLEPRVSGSTTAACDSEIDPE